MGKYKTAEEMLEQAHALDCGCIWDLRDDDTPVYQIKDQWWWNTTVAVIKAYAAQEIERRRPTDEEINNKFAFEPMLQSHINAVCAARWCRDFYREKKEEEPGKQDSFLTWKNLIFTKIPDEGKKDRWIVLTTLNDKGIVFSTIKDVEAGSKEEAISEVQKHYISKIVATSAIKL